MAGAGNRPRPPKAPDVLTLARQRLKEGRYRDTRHAAEQMGKRDLTILEIRQVVEGGYHERSKDDYKVEYKAWNYAIRGTTIDRKRVRVAVSFDEGGLLLFITAIDLDRQDT